MLVMKSTYALKISCFLKRRTEWQFAYLLSACKTHLSKIFTIHVFSCFSSQIWSLPFQKQKLCLTHVIFFFCMFGMFQQTLLLQNSRVPKNTLTSGGRTPWNCFEQRPINRGSPPGRELEQTTQTAGGSSAKQQV